MKAFFTGQPGAREEEPARKERPEFDFAELCTISNY